MAISGEKPDHAGTFHGRHNRVPNLARLYCHYSVLTVSRSEP